MILSKLRRQTSGWLPVALFICVLAGSPLQTLWAQTRIEVPSNRYSVSQDVELGREAAAEAEKQLPLLQDSEVASYVERIGRRLVEAIPREFQHPEFRYYFRVVNARDINAFALPGGPTYINRGTIEAAKVEGEVAGVMAHELSHVALRHGTAQATKGEKLQIGAVAGAILGSILGGGLGSIIAQGSQFGLGAVFLRFSRDFEKQADLLGVQIMARAGYDPRDLANMFQTMEKDGSRAGPQWMSDHPNPGNRYNYIMQEARALRVNPGPSVGDFGRILSRLRSMPRAPSTEEIARDGRRGQRQDPTPVDEPVLDRVEPPSRRYQTYREGNLFEATVPDNWREYADSSVVRFAPAGAFGSRGGRQVFTHGVEFGVARNERRDLTGATQDLVDAFAEGNPDLRQEGALRRDSLAGRNGVFAAFSNRSEYGGVERVALRTTLLRDGNLFYAVTVVPDEEAAQYQPVFSRVLRSLRLRD